MSFTAAGPAAAQGQAAVRYRTELTHSVAPCRSGAPGPAVWLSISGIKQGGGIMRVQLYRGTQEDWLASGRWLNRIELPARAGTMTVCMPVPQAGSYGIAVRHDINGNGKTDLTTDGGGMSNNPSINIFNLGRPSYTRTAFPVARGEVKPMAIRMRYM